MAYTNGSIIITQQFAAVIRGSQSEVKKSLVIRSPAFYQNELNKFTNGEEVSLLITNKKPKRTEQQNRYYWGVYLPLIANSTGERDIDRLHELFKGEFLTEAIVEVLGKKVRMKKSTTDLSISEFCEYIMAIEAETGVSAPPTENYQLVSLKDGV